MIFLRLFVGFMIQMVPYSVLSLYPFKAQFRFSVKKTAAITIAVILLLDCLFSGISTYLKYFVIFDEQALYNTVNIVFMLCLIPCFIWVLFASQAIWQKKLFIYSFTLTSALAITSICNSITGFFDSLSYDGIPYSGVDILVLLIVNLTALPLLIILLKFNYLPVASGMNEREDRSLAILSLVMFIAMASILVFFDYQSLKLHPTLFVAWIMQLFFIFFVYYFFFKMLSLSHQRLIAQQNSFNLEHELEILNEQHLRFNDSIEQSRRMRHDLKHHMLTVRGFIDRGEIKKAEEYLNEYIKIEEEYEMPKLCDVAVINWILNYY